ncbi:hypothetical protein GGS20DRAFT_559024 [Poronia punctata]|nr:hypothetical protein GGS20DRAFT_559024 [Poronia punctata]
MAQFNIRGAESIFQPTATTMTALFWVLTLTIINNDKIRIWRWVFENGRDGRVRPHILRDSNNKIKRARISRQQLQQPPNSRDSDIPKTLRFEVDEEEFVDVNLTDDDSLSDVQTLATIYEEEDEGLRTTFPQHHHRRPRSEGVVLTNARQGQFEDFSEVSPAHSSSSDLAHDEDVPDQQQQQQQQRFQKLPYEAWSISRSSIGSVYPPSDFEAERERLNLRGSLPDYKSDSDSDSDKQLNREAFSILNRGQGSTNVEDEQRESMKVHYNGQQTPTSPEIQLYVGPYSERGYESPSPKSDPPVFDESLVAGSDSGREDQEEMPLPFSHLPGSEEGDDDDQASVTSAPDNSPPPPNARDEDEKTSDKMSEPCSPHPAPEHDDNEDFDQSRTTRLRLEVSGMKMRINPSK